MAQDWSLFALKEPDSLNLFDKLNKAREEIELKTLEDSDRYTNPQCELVMRRKNVEESKHEISKQE